MKPQPAIPRISEVFEQALRRPRDERAAWLERTCGSDARLLEEVRRLLAAHERADSTRTFDQSGGGRQTSSAPLVPEDRIGPYRLLEEIGRGGMGVVYRAEDTRLARQVALKFLPPDRAADQRARERLIAEARAASALDHPNICTIFDLGETESGALYFVMAYYEGETLAARLKRQGALPIDEAVAVIRQAALGLQHAHAAGVVHRDIKPGNIFLTARNEVKVLDFGLAKQQTGSLTDSGQIVGTAAYMSPEQLTGAPVDQRSDLWSLGATLYEAVSGRRPFEGSYEAEILYSIVNEEPSPLGNETPAWLRDLVGRLLDKDANARVGSASATLEALEAQSASRAAPSAAPRPVRNAPSYLTNFFGREAELERLEKLLESNRLVTLTGPGGAGKTRLSVELARRIGSRFRHGACFTPLAAIEDPDLVPLEIAKSVGAEGEAGGAPLEQLQSFLANRRMLLVLDNFEQVLGAAPVVSELLAAAPGLTVVVTSRAPLGIDGERDFPAPPLEAPAGRPSLELLQHASAVRLFIDRAQAVRPDFRLDAANSADVAELCRRLDGLPLAIELAAARTKLFSPKALLARLGERIDLLRASSRGAPARHRTLRQAIAWSYDLLDERAQRFFRRMAAFTNGATLEAAEALWAAADADDGGYDALELLERLCDHNLIRRTSDDDPPRFMLLETVRAFGLDLLREHGEEEDARVAHARHFLALAEAAAPQLTTAEAAQWLDALDADHDNLRAALDWAEKRGDLETALAFGAALWRFWLTRGYTREGFDRLRRLVWAEGPSVRPETRLAALHGFGQLAHYCGRMRESLEASKALIEVARREGDVRSLVGALNTYSWVQIERGAFALGRVYADEALELARREGDTRGAALALNNLGWIAAYEGDYHETTRLHREGLELRLRIGDGRGAAFAQACLAWAEECRGDLDKASKLAAEALAGLESVRDVVTSGFVRLVQARIALNAGRYEEAAELAQREVDRWTPGGHRIVLAWLQLYLGVALHALGRLERARQLLREGGGIFPEIQFPWGLAETLLAQGRAAAAEGEVEIAAERLRRALRISVDIGAKRFIAEGLESLATLYAGGDRSGCAAAAMAEAAEMRLRLGVTAPHSRRPELAETERRCRAKLGDARFEQASAWGRTAGTEEVVSLLTAGSSRPGLTWEGLTSARAGGDDEIKISRRSSVG